MPSLQDLSKITAVTDNAVLLGIAGILFLLIYIGREIIRIRTHLYKLESERINAKVQGVLAAFKALSELKDHGVEESELEAVRRHLMREIGVESAQNEQISARVPDEKQEDVQSENSFPWLVSASASSGDRFARFLLRC